MFMYTYDEHGLVRIIATIDKRQVNRNLKCNIGIVNRDKIGTQTCYIHQCNNKHVCVSILSLFIFCNPYITLYLLVYIHVYTYDRYLYLKYISVSVCVHVLCMCTSAHIPSSGLTSPIGKRGVWRIGKGTRKKVQSNRKKEYW